MKNLTLTIESFITYYGNFINDLNEEAVRFGRPRDARCEGMTVNELEDWVELLKQVKRFGNEAYLVRRFESVKQATERDDSFHWICNNLDLLDEV